MLMCVYHVNLRPERTTYFQHFGNWLRNPCQLKLESSAHATYVVRTCNFRSAWVKRQIHDTKKYHWIIIKKFWYYEYNWAHTFFLIVVSIDIGRCGLSWFKGFNIQFTFCFGVPWIHSKDWEPANINKHFIFQLLHAQCADKMQS